MSRSHFHSPVPGAPDIGLHAHDDGEQERVIVLQTGVDKATMRLAAEELEMLAISAGAEVVGCICQRVLRPDPATYLRSGQLENLREAVEEHHANLVIFSHNLTPGQERNLQKHLSCRVLNKSGLILDIFAQRAQTHEGKLQVELAQLNHLRTRLVRGWTHLERQKGGIGMHGPGESQLETDRRLLQNRVRYLEKQVEKIRCQQAQSRRPRQRAGLPTVALVGYTNAGKSTLFRTLSKDNKVYCADKLFATLDPTVRRLLIPGVGRVALSDTVGFISELPHQLIHAFRATLDEVRNADLLLHVIDSAHPNMEGCITDVEEVLHSLDAHRIDRIDVYNKTDLSHRQIEATDVGDNHTQVAISARTGAGIENLFDLICSRLQNHDLVQGWYRFSADKHMLRARLHSIHAVLKEEFNQDGSVNVFVRLARATWDRLNRGAGRVPGKIDQGIGAKADIAWQTLKQATKP